MKHKSIKNFFPVYIHYLKTKVSLNRRRSEEKVITKGTSKQGEEKFK